MQQRPAARLLVTDPLGRILLFHFAHRSGALAGMSYWATPGGGVEPGETFEQAAMRELWEETGFRVERLSAPIGQRQVVMQLASGEHVLEDERYFHARVAGGALSTAGWSVYETECMTGYRWWTPDEVAQSGDTIWPETLLAMLQAVDATGPA